VLILVLIKVVVVASALGYRKTIYLFSRASSMVFTKAGKTLERLTADMQLFFRSDILFTIFLSWLAVLAA
jgi:hypothetical protein